MTARFEFTLDDVSRVTGHVRGAGGMIGSVSRLDAAAQLARDGRPHGLYEPEPGCVAVYPDYSAVGDGEPYVVSLLTSTWREVPS
jgi:hypothetical protein